MKYFHLAWVLLIVSSASLAQSVLQNNPPSLRWREVNTSHIRVIYPKGVEAEAVRVANTLEHIRNADSRTLGREPRRISIILQNQSSISNGFVSMTPRRSEFYLMPPQDYNFIGNNDWLTLLAVHEYRHVVQFENSITGFNKFFYYAFGPATLAAMANVSAPQWFWEGDAVAMETSLTNSGRGRIPYFNLAFRTNILEGRSFNYHKQYLRSYKHYIPDHYVLGYNMIKYLREKTDDPYVWGKITKRSWSVPFIPFRFSSSIKKVTGLHVVDLYNDMAHTYRLLWQHEIDQLQLSGFETVSSRKSQAFTNYSYPQILENGDVVVMKNGIGNIEQLVALSGGKERVIFTPGIVNDAGMLSVANSKIIWNEYEFDPRWRVKNYSVIKAFDAVTKQKWQVTKKSRCASAALSPDGYKIVTVETDDQYKTTVTVLDFFTRKTLAVFPNPENYFYSMPRFSEDGKKIIALKNTPDGKTIALLDIATLSIKDLLPVSDENIGHPVMKGEHVYFNSPVSGIDNVYSINLRTHKRYQVTCSQYGAYNPAFNKDGTTLYYNEQTRNGLDVVKTTVDTLQWKEFTPTIAARSFYQRLVEQEGKTNLLDSIPQQPLTEKRYSKLRGLINPFSWGAYVDTDLTGANLGISSRDILSTTALSLGYNFNIAERTGAWSATVSYQGLLPIIDISASLADRSVNEGTIPIQVIERGPPPQRDTTRNEIINRNLTFKWQEQSIVAGLRLPLLFTRSKFASGLTISNHIGYTKVTDFSNSLLEGSRFAPARVVNDTIVSVFIFRDYIGNNNLVFNRLRTNGYLYLKQSRRDFLPRWGASANLEWSKTGIGSELDGSLFSFYTQLFLPGFFKHHSINGYWAYQQTLISRDFETNYIFPNRVPIPRGQSVFRAEQFYSMAVNYEMPVWYPDIAIGPVLNIQRVRVAGFLDYGFGSSANSSGSYTSAGTEVKFDINIMRFLPQLDIGFRYTIGISPSVTSFEFLLGTINF
jgi:hypothetical protein